MQGPSELWHPYDMGIVWCEPRHLRCSQSKRHSDLAHQPVQNLRRCKSTTCTPKHVSDCAHAREMQDGMQRVCYTLHSTQQLQFDSANSNLDHRSELEWLSNCPAGGTGKAHLTVVRLSCRMRRLSGDRGRWLREQPLAKHSCAGLPRPPLQSVGLFTVI